MLLVQDHTLSGKNLYLVESPEVGIETYPQQALNKYWASLMTLCKQVLELTKQISQVKVRDPQPNKEAARSDQTWHCLNYKNNFISYILMPL